MSRRPYDEAPAAIEPADGRPALRCLVMRIGGWLLLVLAGYNIAKHWYLIAAAALVIGLGAVYAGDRAFELIHPTPPKARKR